MRPTLNPVERHRDHCRETRAQMSDYLDGELDGYTAACAGRHVRWCPNCRRMPASLGRTIGGLQALRDLPTPADEPKQRRRWRSRIRAGWIQPQYVQVCSRVYSTASTSPPSGSRSRTSWRDELVSGASDGREP